MICPAFDCLQDESTVTLRVRLPYIRGRDIEYEVAAEDESGGTEVTVSVCSYFLRLRIPGSVRESSKAASEYDIDTGYLVMTLEKCVVGTEFEGLDMLSSLIVRNHTVKESLTGYNEAAPSIEVLATELHDDNTGDEEEDQWVQETSRLAITASTITYGFAGRHRGVFRNRQDDISEIVEIPDPDNFPVQDRRQSRQQAAIERFCEEHYLADFYCRDEWDHIVQFHPQSDFSNTNYTEDELQSLVMLPRREFLPDVDQTAWANLANILFAYCYDRRTTQGEPTVESSWTISRISPTLSWLEDFSSVTKSIEAAFVRSLSYPLYRNFDLSFLILDDTKQLVRSGMKTILRALLAIREIFEESESRHLLNVLYLTDFAIWIQTHKSCAEFEADLERCNFRESDMPWDLIALVHAHRPE